MRARPPAHPPAGLTRGQQAARKQLLSFRGVWGAAWGRGGKARGNPAEGMLGSVWFLCNRYTPYPNLYPDQSPSEDWTMEERFRPLTFHGLILRSQLVTLLVRGVCYSESQSVSLSALHRGSGRHEGGRSAVPVPRWGQEPVLGESVCQWAAVQGCVQPSAPSAALCASRGQYGGGTPQSPSP